MRQLGRKGRLGSQTTAPPYGNVRQCPKLSDLKQGRVPTLTDDDVASMCGEFLKSPCYVKTPEAFRELAYQSFCVCATTTQRVGNERALLEKDVQLAEQAGWRGRYPPSPMVYCLLSGRGVAGLGFCQPDYDNPENPVSKKRNLVFGGREVSKLKKATEKFMAALRRARLYYSHELKLAQAVSRLQRADLELEHARKTTEVLRQRIVRLQAAAVQRLGSAGVDAVVNLMTLAGFTAKPGPRPPTTK